MSATFDYTCERCSNLVALEPREAARTKGILCPACGGPEAPGCIVTAEDIAGEHRVFHANGDTVEALREITDKLPPGSTVLSISTPNAVVRDLQGRRQDPFELERTLLAQIGRVDLLPAAAWGAVA